MLSSFVNPLRCSLFQQAFMMMNMMDLIRIRPGCDPNRNFRQSGFFVRIMSTQGMDSNPTPEGVHQDGAEFTMTCLFKSLNIDFDDGAAKSTLVNLSQPFGTQFDQVDKRNIIDQVQHR